MRWLALAFLLLLACTALVACSSHDPPNLLVVHYDAGTDVDEVDGTDGPAELDAAAEANPYLGGPCVDDIQCDDGVACTYDSCDTSGSPPDAGEAGGMPSAGRCLNVPDDTQCSDGIYCNGRDGLVKCVPGHGCEPGPVVTCSRATACEIAKCVEATQSCSYSPRDVDEDGDPDVHCPPGHDCNDLDPDVSSLHPEVCKNGIDDNCNGAIDEMPCVVAQGESCGDAIALGGPGTYAVSTAGANDTFATSCSVTTPSAAGTILGGITVPAGPNVDLAVWATTSAVEVAVALQGTCGEASSELACGSGAGATSVRARARNVAPGTYYVVVTTQSTAAVELEVDLPGAHGRRPTSVDCATAHPDRAGHAHDAVSIIDPPTRTSPTACIPGDAGELTYSQLHALAAARPGRTHRRRPRSRAAATMVFGLRDPACTGASDELSCRLDGAVPIFEQSLSPGTYVITVAATSPIDASLDVELSPPTAPSPDQTCASPPSIGVNASVAFDLSHNEDAIRDGCLAGRSRTRPSTFRFPMHRTFCSSSAWPTPTTARSRSTRPRATPPACSPARPGRHPCALENATSRPVTTEPS